MNTPAALLRLAHGLAQACRPTQPDVQLRTVLGKMLGRQILALRRIMHLQAHAGLCRFAQSLQLG